MCGIAGWIDWETDLAQERRTLSAMNEPLTCRGPDATGAWVTHTTALLHQRLCVVDPAGGSQPMMIENGEHKYVIVYNGELYNTPELRNELLGRGHTFRSHSDTEVLLTAFIEWGAACVERFNGIFAFAIWSEREQSLFMARDRLGVKPLFYAERNGSFLFGSELKALLANPLVQPEIDSEGLAEIFALGPARTPGNGIFRNVSEVKPGYWMRFDRNGLRLHPYWTLRSQPHEDDFETTVATIRELFQDTVRRQLIADVPVCTLLSGGLDSSAITAVAAEEFKKTGLGAIRTFSVDYVDNDIHFTQNQFQPDADAPWILRVSESLGTHHQRFEFDTPELVDALTSAMRARDLPGMADVDASLLLFCREIKKQATVALSGECADEVFGGYPWFHRQEALHAGTFPWSLKLAERVKIMSPALKDRISPEKYVAARYDETLSEVPRLTGESAQEARIREMFYLNLTRWMPTLLDRKDRMSMATGLEVRVPFCDHRLVEYVWNVPWTMKNCHNQAKGIFRRAMKGLLPADVLARRKSPYPKTHNPAYLKMCRDGMLRIVADPSSPILPLLDVAKLKEIAEQSKGHLDMPWFGQLMNVPALFAYITQIDTWLREYRVVIR